MGELKLQETMELPFSYNSVTKNVVAIATLLAIAISIVVVVNLNYPLLSYNGLVTYKSSTTANVVSYEPEGDVKIRDGEQEECDIFTGEWIPNPDAPYYTNKTCWAIHEHQNCMKYGRPDTEFLKWRWKPDGCELPVFDPYEFLEMVRNRSMAFVGDSVGRNQMQSLICLLSRVEYPIDVSTTQDERFKRLVYINYNFTIVSFWTTFLTRAEERESDGPTHTGLFNLYLDEPDQSWATQIDGLDYLILSAGHWFSRPAVYYERRKITGCLFCQLPNVTSLSVAYGYRHAFRTALKAINERKDFKGTTFLRTFAPAHFENGGWNGGGNCIRQRPFKRNETVLEGGDMEFYTIQSQELRVAKKEGEGKKSFMLLDTTKAMLLRPDGHPSRYGHLASENVTLYNDCVHWCLPGPIDSWADLLMHMMKNEARKVQERRVNPQRKKDAIRKAL